MCSLHLTHPSVHTWSSGQPTVQRPGSSRGLPVGAGIRTHNLELPRVSSPTLYPLGQRLPWSLHLTHPKCIHTRSSGQPRHGARGAVRGSVLCSSAPQSWYASPRLEPATFWSQVRLSNHQATTGRCRDVGDWSKITCK